MFIPDLLSLFMASMELVFGPRVQIIEVFLCNERIDGEEGECGKKGCLSKNDGLLISKLAIHANLLVLFCLMRRSMSMGVEDLEQCSMCIMIE